MTGVFALLDPTSWLFWFVAGALLFVIEVLMPTFLALGFGIGAWIVSVLIFFALPSEMVSPPIVFLIWAALSALSWIFLRVVFRNRYSGNKASEGDINEY